MKSSQALYQACVLLEEASAETAAAKRLLFVSFIFNFPIEMPEKKKINRFLGEPFISEKDTCCNVETDLFCEQPGQALLGGL